MWNNPTNDTDPTGFEDSRPSSAPPPTAPPPDEDSQSVPCGTISSNFCVRINFSSASAATVSATLVVPGTPNGTADGTTTTQSASQGSASGDAPAPAIDSTGYDEAANANEGNGINRVVITAPKMIDGNIINFFDINNEDGMRSKFDDVAKQWGLSRYHAIFTAGHGNPLSMTDEYGRRMTPEMYLSRVEQLKSYEPGMDIWALSCNVGTDPASDPGHRWNGIKSFGQRVANLMHGGRLLGANNFVWISSKYPGGLVIAPGKNPSAQWWDTDHWDDKVEPAMDDGPDLAHRGGMVPFTKE